MPPEPLTHSFRAWLTLRLPPGAGVFSNAMKIKKGWNGSVLNERGREPYRFRK